MLLAEDPLDMLITRLRKLPRADARAVIARLAPAERRRVDAALRSPPGETSSEFAPDVAARIVAPITDGAMTAASREALARVTGRSKSTSKSHSPPTPSLFGRLGDAILRR